MKQQRATTLLIGHTLAEGKPLGELLRGMTLPQAQAAAVEVEAGRLARGLEIMGFPSPLIPVASVCPAALPEALRRLAQLPSKLVFQVAMVQTLVYLFAISFFQLGVIKLTSSNLQELAAELGSDQSASLDILSVLPIGLLVGCLVLAGSIAASITLPGRLGRWHAPFQRAEEAALATALANANTPAADRGTVFKTFKVLRPAQASAAELELVLEESLVTATLAHQRAVSAVRLVGFGSLSLIAALATSRIYQFIAMMPTAT